MTNCSGTRKHATNWYIFIYALNIDYFEHFNLIYRTCIKPILIILYKYATYCSIVLNIVNIYILKVIYNVLLPTD